MPLTYESAKSAKIIVIALPRRRGEHGDRYAIKIGFVLTEAPRKNPAWRTWSLGGKIVNAMVALPQRHASTTDRYAILVNVFLDHEATKSAKTIDCFTTAARRARRIVT